MREIDFRAYSISSGNIIQNKDIDFINFKDGYIDAYGDYFYFEEDIILEQYTGLKDKNGVKIYEGDIIRVFGFTINPKTKEKIPYSVVATVKYSETTACFLYLINGSYVYSNFRYTKSDGLEIEVIGNIHERNEDNDK